MKYIFITLFFPIPIIMTSCTPTGNAKPTNPPKTTPTPEPTSTPIPTPTMETNSVPRINTNKTTYCYGGPEPRYGKVTTLTKGGQAEILGREDTGKYWIIKNPNGKGGCWVESEAVSTEGELGYLPYLVSPPTPTPALPAAPENVSAEVICEKKYVQSGNKLVEQWNILVNLSWVDQADDELGYAIYKDGYPETDLPPETSEYSYSFPSEHDVKGTIIFHILAYNQIGSSRAEIQVDYACPNY